MKVINIEPSIEEALSIEETESVLTEAALEMEETGGAAIEKIETYLAGRYYFKYDCVRSRVLYRAKGNEKFELLTDYDTNCLLRELQKAKIKVSITALRSILNSSFSRKFDPFAEFFESLTPWDQETDHIAELAGTVKTKNDAMWLKFFRKWLVWLVGTALDKKVSNQLFLLLIGPQNTGKTTWLTRLVPTELSDYRYSGMVRPENRDTLIHMTETMLVIWDEMQGLSKSDVESLKALITVDAIRFRRPYGYNSENLPRRASLCGSINNHQFLQDQTGNRRFLCIQINEIDYLHTVDLRKVYAQALFLFKSGKFQYWLSPEDVKEINVTNEKHRVISLQEDLLLTYYERTDDGDAGAMLLSATEIATGISQKTKLYISDACIQQFGKALKKHNFSRLKRGDRYVYRVKEKDEEVIGYESRYRKDDDMEV